MKTTEPTKKDFQTALAVLVAVSEAIRDLSETEHCKNLGGVPSGSLYGHLMPLVDEQTYTAIIERLKGAGLVRETPAHLLVWCGPARVPGKVAP